MNERLTKLMQEAGYAAPEIAGRAHKLSELILQDIIELCEQGNATQTTSNGIVILLKERYGVK